MKVSDDTPRTAIARNVHNLPQLIEEHDAAVQQLEGHLAQYLADPSKLPEKRPTCKPAKKDRKLLAGGEKKIDAIDYLSVKIKKLSFEIYEARQAVDRRDVMPYGFASFPHIEDAHSVAHYARTHHKKGKDANVRLAPKPNDLLWQNLPMSRATRRNRAFWDGLWIFLLSALFVVPNLLTSIFLSDLSHLGLVWDGFQTSLNAHPTGWGIFQGIIAPAVQFLFYLFIPWFFRRMLTHAGDISRTSRERHVTSRLYAFFVFNNLIVFSVFASAWRYVAAVIGAQDQGVWNAIQNGHLFQQLMIGLCNVSTYWLTWQMQHNLSAATDLAQILPLVWGTFIRKTSHPTPRQIIELTAPQPMEYADYYNNFLFVATVGLCFGPIQPLIIPITAFYLGIEVWFKTYLLQYVLITKTESGGAFWRLLINRLLFGMLLGNAVIALVVGAQGLPDANVVTVARNGAMLYAMVPLPFLLFAFKWYISRQFDDKISYYTTETDNVDAEGQGHSAPLTPTKPRRSDKVSVRFGHPAMYKPLLTPMVHARSQHLLKDVLHKTSSRDEYASPHHSTPTFGYSDMYMSDMQHTTPGKAAKADVELDIPVEAVRESELDFENFKRREEFREEFGGDGELYGRPQDLISRPGTPSTFAAATLMEAQGAVDAYAGAADVGERSSLEEQRRGRSRSTSSSGTLGHHDEHDGDGDAESEFFGRQRSAATPEPLLLHYDIENGNDGDDGDDDVAPRPDYLGRERMESIDLHIPDGRLNTRDVLAAGGLDRGMVSREPSRR